MQEIFANFISGIMILFERPVRIGDTITIGNLSGTVSKIRIRATTITDFDRKDIIVPNKTFITGQLINWSLTDTVTRVTLKLGIDYGSDLDLVRDLLLKGAHENPRVLKDPEPIVYFLNFGESSLTTNCACTFVTWVTATRRWTRSIATSTASSRPTTSRSRYARSRCS